MAVEISDEERDVKDVGEHDARWRIARSLQRRTIRLHMTNAAETGVQVQDQKADKSSYLF